ncbi:DUF4397 domain-containing protein [Terrimonas sp. NA20]|uniref:DUF4397 domain-containing protein n=1 Tax=Terrimonas ginsenosidimutans TaxID=2908004 RepID=A0ABS9KYX9_9BACT|nr:DUF4397 domain-containing protein [Terrimonas ginsenosidimutans]MCG2617520.1 DUF4397 domain-containing protein [Terrimonas ginsenosidimutans]
MKSVFSNFRSGILTIALAAVAATIFVSCSKNNDGDGQTQPAAGLLAVNLAPDQSALVLTLNGNSLTNFPLPYTNFTGGYLPVFPGSRTLDAYSSNSTSSQPLASTTAALDVEKYYSAFTIGAGNKYRNVIVQDNFDSLNANGNAYIRFVNAIIDSVQLPVVVIRANGTDVVNRQAPYASVSDFVAVTPGSVLIDVNNNAGVDADRTLTLEQNKVYTVLLTGLPGTTPSGEMIKFITNGTVTDDQARGAGARRAAN